MSTYKQILDALTTSIKKENEELESQLALATIDWKMEKEQRLKSEEKLQQLLLFYSMQCLKDVPE
jgi:hypothetical protein